IRGYKVTGVQTCALPICKDVKGKHLFAGGFLGLDNIGVFDRSRPLPSGVHLEQADGTAWMAFFCMMLLAMAVELAREDPSYEDRSEERRVGKDGTYGAAM